MKEGPEAVRRFVKNPANQQYLHVYLHIPQMREILTENCDEKLKQIVNRSFAERHEAFEPDFPPEIKMDDKNTPAAGAQERKMKVVRLQPDRVFMHAMKNFNITARPSTHAEQLFAAQEAAIRERASRAFGRNIKTSKTADKKSNLPSIEETFPQQYVDLKDDISLAYSLETQSGSHIATLSHKNHGPSLRVAHSFCGQPIPTVYTVDPQGRCWVNLLDPQNKHMFREFIIAANDSDPDDSC